MNASSAGERGALKASSMHRTALPNSPLDMACRAAQVLSSGKGARESMGRGPRPVFELCCHL